MNEVKNNDWYPKSLTSTILSIILGIMTGTIINLFTGSFPSNPWLFIFLIVAIALFIGSSIALLKILNIRILIDDSFSKNIFANGKADASQRVSPNTLWEKTIEELDESQKNKFMYWKRLGIISLGVGLVLFLCSNVVSLINNSKHENKLIEKSSAILDSIDHLNRKIDYQNKLILQMTDSIHSIKKENRISRGSCIEKEKNKENQQQANPKSVTSTKLIKK